jgi:hypothetical protein
LECRDPATLAEFYSGLTGWPVVHASADWYSLGENEKAGFHLSFQRAPGHQPPTWPDPASSMQIHLHFRVNDLDAAERIVLALGGTKLDDQPGRTARRSTPIRQVIRSALSRPEVALSSHWTSTRRMHQPSQSADKAPCAYMWAKGALAQGAREATVTRAACGPEA